MIDPLTRLSSALGLGDDPRAILEPLAALYEEIDREVAGGSSGLAMPCRSGCDACCHESVFLSAPEFLAVAAHLARTRTKAEIEALHAEMVAVAERYEDELELLETIEGSERDEVAARVKFRCPLLEAGGLCTVYEARELNARTFGLAFDRARGHAYGCELSHARLRVLPAEASKGLFDAREARRRLVARVPGASGIVHVYPWWFRKFGALLF
jgi:Fe-S-cluster containining protein